MSSHRAGLERCRRLLTQGSAGHLPSPLLPDSSLEGERVWEVKALKAEEVGLELSGEAETEDN